MKIDQTAASTIKGLSSQLDAKVQNAGFLEVAAQELATSLHTHFKESVALARVFLTVPFGDLPKDNQEFVRKLAGGAGAGGQLKDTTPVLSLVGTHGEEDSWNDRRKSQGHVGIPLISSAFVGAIPMISRLLKELGVPLDWIDSHDSEIIKKMGGSAGLFFVEDAGSATDTEGRKIIAAQDFVSGHKIKSVFGTGETYTTGQILVAVLFCRDPFKRTTAEHFPPLASSFKAKTTALVGGGKIFSA